MSGIFALLFVFGAALSLSVSAAVVPRDGRPQLNGMTVFGYQGWYPIRYANGTGTNFKWFSPPDVTPGPPDYPQTQGKSYTQPHAMMLMSSF